MDEAEAFVGHPLPDPAELGPEYDAYQMRRAAEELAKLPDDQWAVCLPELLRLGTVIRERMSRYRRAA